MGRRNKQAGLPGGFKKPITIIVIVLAIMLPSVYPLYNTAFTFNLTSVIKNSVSDETSLDTHSGKDGNLVDALALMDKDRMNIVLLGFDRTDSKEEYENIFRPDAIIIASLDLDTAEVSLVSVPRDSYVKISGLEVHDKINHAYMYGYRNAGDGEDPHRKGLETTLLTIEDFLDGIPLHEYIVLDIEGAIQIIDSIGGLHYDVDAEVRTRIGQGRVVLETGYQHLDGKQFMDYVRNRAPQHGGSAGRMERQQKILLALFKKFRDEGRLTDLPDLFVDFRQAIETELNLPRVASLAAFALKVDPAEIRAYTFDGRGQLSHCEGQNIWYWVINESKRVEIIETVFGVTVEKRPEISLPGPYYPSPQEDQPDPDEEGIPFEEDEEIFLEEGEEIFFEENGEIFNGELQDISNSS